MPANLSGIIFSQVYTDNTGGPGAEFDTDGDGVATQEDEFVSIANTTGAPVDISGWQIWSDSAGSGAPDTPLDGLYHTFAPGTFLSAGNSLTIINEITGAGPGSTFAIEASEGGVESGAGGVSTNLLTEGDGGSTTESVVLLNPATGEYIVFNYGPDPFDPSSISGFPGTTNVGEVDAEAVLPDPGTGLSVQYDEATDTYVLDDVFVPCFTPGTRISTVDGTMPVEDLKVGDLLITYGHAPEAVSAIIEHMINLTDPKNTKHKPILLNRGCLGPDRPLRALLVSPQHRFLMEDDAGASVLVPAKALLDRPGVRIAHGKQKARYIQVVCARHSVIASELVWTESFYPGAHALKACDDASRRTLFQIFPELHEGDLPAPAFPLLSVSEATRQKLHPICDQTTRNSTAPASKARSSGRTAA